MLIVQRCIILILTSPNLILIILIFYTGFKFCDIYRRLCLARRCAVFDGLAFIFCTRSTACCLHSGVIITPQAPIKREVQIRAVSGANAGILPILIRNMVCCAADGIHKVEGEGLCLSVIIFGLYILLLLDIAELSVAGSIFCTRALRSQLIHIVNIWNCCF